MELDELDVGDGDSGPQRHREAVARRLEWVRRHREHLTRAAGRRQHVRGTDLAHEPVGAEGGDAAAAPALDEEVEREPALEDRDRGTAHGLDERALDLGPRRGASRVHDARQRVSTFASELESPVGRSIERRAHRDELGHPIGPLVDEDTDGFDVAQPRSGRERVGEMEVGRVGITGEDRGDAALCPPRGGLVELAFRQHADTEAECIGCPHRGRQPRDSAAEDQKIEPVVEGGVVARHRRHPPVAPTLSMRRAFPNRAAPSRRSSPVSGSTGLSDLASTTAT